MSGHDEVPRVTAIEGPSIFETPIDAFFQSVFPFDELQAKFDEQFLARVLRRIAAMEEMDPDRHLMRRSVELIANSLDSPDAPIKLKIARPRAGSPPSFLARERRDLFCYGVALTVWREGGHVEQIEAGLIAAIQEHKISRKTVYAALKRAAVVSRVWRKMDETLVGRPEAGQWLNSRAVLLQFENWLDRYLNEGPRRKR